MLSVGCVCHMKMGLLKRPSPVLFNRKKYVFIQRPMSNKKVLRVVHIIQGKKPWMVFKVLQA